MLRDSSVADGLGDNQDLVRLLLDSTGEGIYGIDLDGNCTFANPACLKLLGYESDADLLGKHMHRLVHHTRANGDPYPVEECRIYRAFWQREGVHVDDEVMWCSDGVSFPAEYWSYPVEHDGELVGCVLTFVDITGRLRVEEELRQSEKMAALGKLSAGLAHELNNPAAAAGRASSQLSEALDDLRTATVALVRADIDQACWERLVEWDRELHGRGAAPADLSPLEASDWEEALLGWLDARGIDDGWEIAPTLVEAAVRREDLDQIASGVPADAAGRAIAWLAKSFTARELADAVARSSRSISKLVNAAKSFSYMDQAPVQNVDIHQGIEDTITVVGERLGRGIEVVREYAPNLPRVQAPGGELNQVWMNLIDNAIGALGGQGTITVRSRHDGERLTVEIADDGPGIPPEIQSRVFDPFFTTKEVGEGAGLGLDLARRIVTMRCGGQIGFRSSPGETVFWVHLPSE